MDYLRVYDMLRKVGAYTEEPETIEVNTFENDAESAADDVLDPETTGGDYFDSILDTFAAHMKGGDSDEEDDVKDVEDVQNEDAKKDVNEESDSETVVENVNTTIELGDDSEDTPTPEKDIQKDSKEDPEVGSDEETVVENFKLDQVELGDDDEDDLATKIQNVIERSEMDSIDDDMEEMANGAAEDIDGGKASSKKTKKPKTKKPSTKKKTQDKSTEKIPDVKSTPTVVPVEPAVILPVEPKETIEVTEAVELGISSSDNEKDEDKEEETDDIEANDNIEPSSESDESEPEALGSFESINDVVSKFKNL